MSCADRWKRYLEMREVDQDFNAYRYVFGTKKATSKLEQMYEKLTVSKEIKLNRLRALALQPEDVRLTVPECCSCRVCDEHKIYLMNISQLLHHCLQLEMKNKNLMQQISSVPVRAIVQGSKMCVVCKKNAVKSSTSNICGPVCDRIKRNNTLRKSRANKKQKVNTSGKSSIR
jgi:hypothetical protein